MSAATRLRRLNETAEIVVLEKGPYVSFANCGLPYYISREISNREALKVETPESLSAKFQLDIRVQSEAVKIKVEDKIINIQGPDGLYDLSYDALILSPGAKPFVPDIKGLDSIHHAFSLRNIPDVDRIDAFIEKNKSRKATVIGAGFIGLEMAESLKNRGLDVTVVEMAPHVLPPLDEEMARFAESELKHHGIKVITSKSASEITQTHVILNDDTELESDLVILAIGVVPESTLAKDAGLELGIRGSIKVNEKYQTSNQDIYAVGDAISVTHSITKEEVLIALASPANRQGRQVADVIMGLDRKNKGSLGTSIVRIFEMAFGSTGLNERQIKAHGYDYDVAHVTANHHVSYFPGAKPVTLKLLFNPKDGSIYGAQAFGEEGVDKRIDVLATAIKANMKVEDLVELELSYAPPYGAAKDLVNLVGYAAQNLMEGLSESVQWHELEDLMEDGAVLLDVRGPLEFRMAHIENAKNIPLHFLRCRFHELPYDKLIITSCASGQSSYNAERILKQAGFKVKNFDGGLRLYNQVMPEKIIIG